MTISSSLNAGVAALSANATRLAAISDNIANSATYGYKRVETDFQSMVISSDGGSYSAGGVRSNTQRLIDESGSLVTTSNATDLAVRGRGMLPVAAASEVAISNGNPQMMLTTTGSFRTDAEGRLVSDSGLVLMGWPAGPDGSVPEFPRDTSDGLEPVQINVNQLTGEPTTNISLGINLPATETGAGSTGDPQQLS
ncbi:MAG: flagellar hook-basal body complex protein, partial [Roseovarius gahaiensis]